MMEKTNLIPNQKQRKEWKKYIDRKVSSSVGMIYMATIVLMSILVLMKQGTGDGNLREENLNKVVLGETSIHHASRHLFKAPKKATLFLGIFSASGLWKYDRRRTYIRDTYLNQKHDDHICKLSEFISEANLPESQRNCQIVYSFIIAGGDRNRPTDHDDDEPLTLATDRFGNSEDDCIYLNIRENMEHGKTATFFKAVVDIAKKYNIDYIAKTDDDTVHNKDLIQDWINEDLPPAPYNRRIFGGEARISWRKEVIYGGGEFYFMSTDLADYVGNELTAHERRQQSVFIEDLDMGTFVHSHPRPVKFLNLRQRKIWSHPHKTEAEFRFKYVTHKDVLRFSSTVPWFQQCDHVVKRVGF